MQASTRFLQFWAKTSDAQKPPLHPVAYHLLDVAAVANTLLEASPTFVKRVAHRLGIDPADLRGAAVFLVALHDIGKFSHPFQGQAAAFWPSALGPFKPVPAAPRHDLAGYALLREPLADLLVPVLPGWRLSSLDMLLRAICGHHGRPPDDQALEKIIIAELAGSVAIEAARDLTVALRDLLTPPALPVPRSKRDAAILAWWLAGITVAADWIGSREADFKFMPPCRSVAEYWHGIALPQAKAAVAGCGLLPVRGAENPGIGGLFPEIQTPTPLQDWAAQVDLPAEPVSALIEDMTGAGKTEAALILAQRLIAAGRAEGVFVALPTMATANAMYERLCRSYRALFAADASPSLVLAHGRRGLNDGFVGSIMHDVAADQEPGRPSDPADETAGAQCAAWLAADRRRAFMAHVGVGTIDQALMAVLPTRHAPLRLFGLAQRVLIVDEAHAYDAYMAQELERLIEFHAALGGSSIVLSATLPLATRASLSAAYARGIGTDIRAPTEMAYPLATLLSPAGAVETPCAPRKNLGRRLPVCRLESEAIAIAEIANAAGSGAAIAWVRNSVDDAITACAELCRQGVDADLFHARFAMGDRLAIEQRVLSRFGKHPSDKRAGVLVATQVIEQSLDLDFDLMVTDLAPLDLLIQRAGRLWRHERTGRLIDTARLLVLSPDPAGAIGTDWVSSPLRRTSFVYADHALLWRSASALFAAGAIDTPDNLRALIEAAYDRAGPVPASLQRSADNAEGKAGAEKSVARQNLLDLASGYSRSAGLWEPDTRTPTRLGEAQTLLRLGRLEGERIVPWCAGKTASAAWAMSEISLAARRVSRAVVPDGLAKAVAQAKTSWAAWESEVPLLVLEPAAGGRWSASITTRNRGDQTITYCARTGLMFD